ncbi:hypothetical protein [Flectobacillus longus]|uniref:hypothetical protein n=1 Tax=Flectobacillus longus TaxID=2984207 RepID=UPI0024B7BEF9|nr:hypothetical protein [Flectobacillus longus]MDI9881965.1 hypothetical protein [Flectobacillus longus]
MPTTVYFFKKKDTIGLLLNPNTPEKTKSMVRPVFSKNVNERFFKTDYISIHDSEKGIFYHGVVEAVLFNDLEHAWKAYAVLLPNDNEK